jgi:protein TonB
MLMPRHEILSVRSSGMTPRRAMIVGTVAMLHVAVVYALISGMAGTIIRALPPDIVMVHTDEQPVPPKPVTLPVQKMVVPTTPTETVPVPKIDIAPDPVAKPITVASTPTNPTPPTPDTGASGVMNTHSTPPYPTEARTASHQGTVLLSMTVGLTGDVTAATVVQYSGYAELDQAAVNWVIGHWKYKPAVQGGVAVTSMTQAAVKFDLRQAGR